MDHRIIEVRGSAVAASTASAVGQVMRGAESWQFFAFVFGAVVAVAFGFIDEVKDDWWKWRIGLKVAAFLEFGYLTLLSSWGATSSWACCRAGGPSDTSHDRRRLHCVTRRKERE